MTYQLQFSLYIRVILYSSICQHRNKSVIIKNTNCEAKEKDMFGSWNKRNEQISVDITQLKSQIAESNSITDAIDRSMAVIEFNPDGIVQKANSNFLQTVGYNEHEVIGKHHQIFCTAEYRNSNEYHQFWRSLNQGQYFSGEFERIGKDGNIIWLEASYNPIFDNNGKLSKIVKFASNITDKAEKAQEQESMVNAISRSMAVIEFDMSGKVLTANDNFLSATGYSLAQIQGQHHSIFCDAELANSTEYSSMWSTLNRGQYVSGQFKRVDSSGNELWLEASYNPIFNIKGELSKVVKFATDITARLTASNEAREVAYDTSLQADKSAQEGAQVVAETISIMTSLSTDITQASENLNALNKQSDQINNIVATISSIAEQTNLLALNAAIEAARAGEQGRGFAVVADEVRGLAARTSTSTTEIADVVKKNVELSQLATNTMQSSIEQVSTGTDLVERLSSSISEINSGINQIVKTMDKLNQQN